MSQKVDTSFDFGFTLTDNPEEAIHLQNQVEQTTQVLTETQQTAQSLQTKLDLILSSVNGFLDNLAKEPQKKYLLWPDRANKIALYKKHLEALLK